ncbi:MAG: hypothetical protein K6F80_00745 [Oscillospiraceae bacterium]|nr:hypothetical protein [Oscillospiraceae bacterium]
MQYKTTQLQLTKRFPTYQLYVTAASRVYRPEEIFKVCILETLRWLRSRLRDFPDLPDDSNAPEPADYSQFSLDSLHSFNFEAGGSVDVIYSAKQKIWSFCITEADMGANPGTAVARPPVIGRTFRTEMSYHLIGECVEIGIRTICSDPYDCDAPCEVFRPTVVKALAADPDLILRHSGLNLNGSAVVPDTKDTAERVCELLSDEKFELPVVLVTEPKAEQAAPKLPELTAKPSALNVTKGFSPKIGLDSLTVDYSKTEVKSRSFSEKPAKKSAPAPKPSLHLQNPPPPVQELPAFPYERLANSILGFGVVVYITDKQRSLFNQKLGTDLRAGDIALRHGRETDRFLLKNWRSDPEALYQTLKVQIKTSPKRQNYHFGDVVFHSEAHLLELHSRRHDTESLEETCRLYHLENKELRNQVRELTQEKADMQKSWESERNTQKKLLSAQETVDKLTEQLQFLKAQQAEREEAYRRAAALTEFYRKKADIAAGFPDSRERICDWAEKLFSEELVITNDARSALRKYTGQLDTVILCDGLLFLHAYARYRREEIDAAELSLYAERYVWDVQGCGKEALRMRRSDYLTTHGGKQYLLDQHIKYGVSAQVLVRIYFCWAEDLRQIIVGYLPGHLPTVKKGT